MSFEEDADTEPMMLAQPPAPALVEWRPEFLDQIWADVSHWHVLVDADRYAAANKPGLIGVKIAECGLRARMGIEMAAAAEARGLIVVGYQFGMTNPEKFVEMWPTKPGRIRCFDFEGATAAIANLEHCVKVAEAADGKPPWIYYGGEEWRRCKQPAGTAAARCPSWQSQYAEHLRPLPNVGPLCAWQARGGSTSGPDEMPLGHPGVGSDGSPIDMSVLLCSLTDLWKMAGVAPAAVTPPTEVA